MDNYEGKDRSRFFRQQIADKEEILNLVFGISEVGICILDNAGKFVEVNQIYCDFHGYTREEMVGEPFTMLVPEENRRAAVDLYKDYLVGMPEIPLEWTGLDKQGNQLKVMLNPGYLITDDGEQFVIATAVDVTDMRFSKELFADIGNKLRESYNEIYLISCETQKFVRVNREGLQNSGYTLTELLEMTPLDLWKDMSRSSFQTLTSMIESEEKDVMVYETMHQRKDGSKYEVEISLRLLRDEAPPMFVAIVHDVTEAKKLLKVRQELVVARNIRDNLIPIDPPAIEGYDIEGTILSSPTMGGDFYDFIPSGEHSTAFCVGDVTGRGIPAALLMSGLHTMVRSQTFLKAGASEILRFTNIMLFRYAGTSKFAKMFVGLLDHKAHQMTYANAGFQPPLLLKAGARKPLLLEKGGYALGLKQDSFYAERRLPLEKGDVLVVFSDGLIKAVGKEEQEFGLDKLGVLVKLVKDKPAVTIVEEILHAVVQHISPLHVSDDMTLMVVKRVG
jgi:PAS domain S-box-containing protein